MRKTIFMLLTLLSAAFCNTYAQDTLWIRYDNRFQKNTVINIVDVDSIEVKNNQLCFYRGTENKNQSLPVDKADAMFADPGRILLKPNTYAGTDGNTHAYAHTYPYADTEAAGDTGYQQDKGDMRAGNAQVQLSQRGKGSAGSRDRIKPCW